jgi:CBS domain containing-hemolysin-like protein
LPARITNFFFAPPCPPRRSPPGPAAPGVAPSPQVLEEIVGEIYDEDDAARGEDVADRGLIRRVVRADDGASSPAYAIKGEAELDDVRAALFPEDGGDPGDAPAAAPPPLDDEDLDCVTLSGYLCALRGEIPAEGDAVEASGFTFTVVESDERRVREVRAVRAADAAADDDCPSCDE